MATSINSLLWALDFQQEYMDDWPDIFAPLKDQIKTLYWEGRFLKVFLSYAAKWCNEQNSSNDFFKNIEDLANKASKSMSDYSHNRSDINKAREMILEISDYREKLELIKPKIGEYIKVPNAQKSSNPNNSEPVVGFIDFLLEIQEELLKFMSDSVTPVEKQLQTLRSELRFLVFILVDTPLQCTELEMAKFLLRDIEALVNDAGSFFYFFFTRKGEEINAREMNIALSDVIQKIELVKADIKEHLKDSKSSPSEGTPKTAELAVSFVDFLLEDLKELLNCNADWILPIKDEVESLLEEITSLRSFLLDSTEQQTEHEQVKDLAKLVGDVAHEIEYVIGSFVINDCPLWYFTSRLSHVQEEIKLIKTEITEIYDKKLYGIGVLKLEKISSGLPSRPESPIVDQIVVGFEDEATTLIERLTGLPAQLEVISIVGMPGLGKTSLSKKLYNNPFITYHFYIRAWCCVSQMYQTRELLLSILSYVIELTDRIYKMSDESLAEELYKRLKGKRYLIVMDDMWSINAWNDLKRSFPNDNNGSRVMLTSRLKDVALQVKPDSIPHELRFFSDEESWNLLETKIFQTQPCSPNLVETGRQIAKGCRGLPLAVVVIAGLLAKKHKQKQLWEQVAQSLNSRNSGELEQCMATLELSYKHLPDHLRPCFLFCGAFLEDKEILVQKLIRLWIAEGFVRKNGQKSVEDVAEEYLKDLIDRNLVLVSRRKSKGGVKSCHVHDLLRDLCLKKAKEENFLQLIHGSTIDEKCGRLCIHSQPSYFFQSRPSGSHVRSLLCFASLRLKIYYADCCFSFVPRTFKFLRVLDLECVHMGQSFPNGIELLVHLRYLAVLGDIDSIPSSINNLWNLETLIVKGLLGEITLPDAVLNMVKLRHLHINNRVSSSSSSETENISDKSFRSSSLQTFSTPALDHYEGEKMMRRLPNLRKLRCIFLESRSRYRECCGKKICHFPRLHFLTQLESLKVFYNGPERCPGVFDFPSNLKKLTLSKFRLPWKELPKIARLPNLEVLKLLFKAFEGQEWESGDGEFPKLKFLKLDSLNIAKWDAYKEQFPLLERLVLNRCKQLQNIPSSFTDIPTLQMIEVNWCSPWAAKSAMQIQADQEDMGIEGLKVLVYPPDQRLRSSP